MAKKLGVFSVVLMFINSSLGVGIFIKSKEINNNVNGNLMLSIIPLILAIVCVVALSLTFKEIGKHTIGNNEGIVGWNKRFNGKEIYSASRNFMTYLCIPINYFTMPIYGIMCLQESFGFSVDWWMVLLISFAISFWIALSGLSTHWNNVQNHAFTALKFLPIIGAVVCGIISIASTGATTTGYSSDSTYFIQTTTTLGILGSIPAALFTIDGFYAAVSAQGEMKKPDKFSFAFLLGALITSAIILSVYLLVLFGSTDGTFASLRGWFASSDGQILIKIFQVLIVIGAIGSINATGLHSAILFNELAEQRKIVGWQLFKNNERKRGVYLTLIYIAFFFVVFGVLGSFMSVSNNYEKEAWVANQNVINLYQMCDLLTNWIAIITMLLIAFSLIGCWKEVKKDVWFRIFVVTVVSIIFVAAGTLCVMPIGELVYGLSNNETDSLMSSVPQIIVLFIMLGVMFLPHLLNEWYKKIKLRVNSVKQI